jgi:hypothetical protein
MTQKFKIFGTATAVKRIIQAILMLSLVTFMIGCQRGEPVDIGATFIGGTQGIEIEFRQGMPPAEVWDANTYPFDISVEIENKGEWNTNQGEVKIQLSGFNAAAFGVTEQDLIKAPQEDIRGLSRDMQGNILPATITNVDFTGLAYQGTLSSDEQFVITADICYSYGTKATSKICIKRDLRGVDARVCTVTEEKEIKNSGAPLQIVELRESAAGQDQIQVTFKIQNQGTGAPYQLGSKCPQELTERTRKVDTVFVKVDSGLPAQPACSSMKDENGNVVPDTNEGYVKLINGEAIVSCRQAVQTTTDFEQLINLELQYDYEQAIESPLLVKRSQ